MREASRSGNGGRFANRRIQNKKGKQKMKVVGGMVGGCAWGGNGPYFLL